MTKKERKVFDNSFETFIFANYNQIKQKYLLNLIDMKNRLLLYAFAFMTLTQVLWMASCTSNPKQVEETDNRAVIRFETTMGNFEMALFNETPIHRDAYLLLARIGYYDSILIHRVIDNFVVQAGDPNSKNALPGELVGDGEPFKLPSEIRFPKLYHKRGMVNAAREGDETNPDRLSSGSQFAIMTCGPLNEGQIKRGQERIWAGTDSAVNLPKEIIDTYMEEGGSPHLDAQYTVFAEIVKCMDVVDKIQKVETDPNDRPVKDVRILRTVVVKDYK